MDHETAELEEPVTAAVNCWLPDDCNVAADGKRETEGATVLTERPGSL